MGDVVHALPFLHAVRRRWPRASISWVINRGLANLLEGHPDLDELILFDRPRPALAWRSLQAFGGFLSDLRGRRFDLVLDLQGLLRSGVMSGATRAKVRWGLAESREGARWFYHVAQPTGPRGTHAVERLLRLAESLGASARPASFHVPVTETDRESIRARIGHLPHPRLAMHLGARWVTKRWPVEHFAEIARRASQTFQAGLVLVGGPEDRALADACASSLGGSPVVDLCGGTTLRQLAAVSEQVDLLLSNDSGPLHLAAAMGTPVIGIYLCTSPSMTGPYGAHGQVVQTGVACAASCLKQCPDRICTRELTPDRVWPVVRRALAGSRDEVWSRTTEPSWPALEIQ